MIDRLLLDHHIWVEALVGLCGAGISFMEVLLLRQQQDPVRLRSVDEYPQLSSRMFRWFVVAQIVVTLCFAAVCTAVLIWVLYRGLALGFLVLAAIVVGWSGFSVLRSVLLWRDRATHPSEPTTWQTYRRAFRQSLGLACIAGVLGFWFQSVFLVSVMLVGAFHVYLSFWRFRNLHEEFVLRSG